MKNTSPIKVETVVSAPIEKVWVFWTEPQHITQWTFASSDWHAPYAENYLRVNGNYKTMMAAKNGSFSFDFEGIYNTIEAHKRIAGNPIFFPTE